MKRFSPLLKRIVFLNFLILWILSYPISAQQSSIDQRAALIIGNSDYLSGPLLNPVNDARAMARALQETGFEVMKYENLETQADMKRAIRDFGMKIQNGGVGLVYYAGHGIQVNGKNYLVPTKAEIFSEEEVEYECVDAGFILAQMESARNRMNIVILDACRNNPFARSWRSASQGLAFISAPTGTLIAYATAPGSVASDGTGENGLYTEELLKQIRQQGIKIEDVFKKVRVNVLDRSQKKQTPWESSSLIGDFYFVEPFADLTSSTENVSENRITEVPLKDPPGSKGSLNFQWKSANNNFSIFLDNTNITSETINTGCGDHLLVYHPGRNEYYLLENYYNFQDNTFRDAKLMPFENGICWMSKNNKYWFYDMGKDITPQTTIAFFDDHKVIFNKLTGQYYVCYYFITNADGYPHSAEAVYTFNGTLWRYDGQFYYLYVQGDQIAARTWSNWSGNDLLVFDEQGTSSYLLKDFYNRKDNQLYPAEIIAGPGIITWKRSGNLYYMYRGDNQFASQDNTVASFSGNDLLVYEKSYQQTYLLQNWNNSDDGLLRSPVILFSRSGALWRRSGNTFWLYRQGQLVEIQLTSTWNGNDLEVYDPTLNITYVFSNYLYSDDNSLRAAIIKQ